MGTIPLQNGEGTVIIPAGIEVLSTSAIILPKESLLAEEHWTATDAAKNLSNFTLKNTGFITITKAAGISNPAPFFYKWSSKFNFTTSTGTYNTRGCWPKF